MSTEISDEILGAYIDDELDAAERARLLERMMREPVLAARACELWKLKQMLRGAYPLPQATQAEEAASRRASRRLENSALARRPRIALPALPALAASALLALGTLAGWFASAHFDEERELNRQIAEARAAGGRILLHIFSDAPAHMETALAKAERLAQERDAQGRPLRIELLANGPGLHLLRAGGSPYAERIAALRHYDNLRLVACREAIERMRERGIEVVLLPGVEETGSAENELAEKLTQGWRYIQT
ncbi:MAG: DsrE family protein [Rhodocyclaceae bacterium]|nr:DsrE family protein [Rhodocyclaceae bacterium]